MSKTVVIAGAGPGLGTGLARRFGQAGYQVALIARNAERLEGVVKMLSAEGITSKSFPSDLTKPDQMAKAFSDICDAFGQIDTLFVNAVSPPAHPSKLTAVAATPEMVRMQFEARVIPTVSAVNHVLPDMMERGEGAIVVTTGLSAHVTVPFITPISMALAAIRKYALGLHAEVADKGIYVVTVALGVVVKQGDAESGPETLADGYFDLVQKREQSDAVFGSMDVTQQQLDELKGWLDHQAASMDK